MHLIFIIHTLHRKYQASLLVLPSQAVIKKVKKIPEVIFYIWSEKTQG